MAVGMCPRGTGTGVKRHVESVCVGFLAHPLCLPPLVFVCVCVCVRRCVYGYVCEAWVYIVALLVVADSAK